MKKTIRPDQSLLPKMYLTWATTREGQVWLDCEKGIKINQPEEWMKRSYANINYRNQNDAKICVHSGTGLKYAYLKYHDETKLLEFAVVEMSSNRTGGARHWEYAAESERYFLDKEKRVYTANGKEATGLFKAYKNHMTNNFSDYLRVLFRCHYNNDNSINEFKKFIGQNAVVVNNGRHLSLNYLWHVQIWYKCKTGSKTTGKVQKIIDEITSLPHSDISDIFARFKPKVEEGVTYPRHMNDIIFFEQLNDTWNVMRYCYRIGDDSGVESYRIYISEDGDCKITRINDANEWVPAKNLYDGWSSSYGRIVNFDDMVKSKRLSYIMSILKDFPEYKQLSYLASIIKFPEVEKLYKMGYETLAKDLLVGNTVHANIKNRFGEPNKKAKTLFSQLGVNKHQLDTYMKCCNKSHIAYSDELEGRYYTDGISTIKHYFGNDISAIDNETFDKLLQCSARLRQRFWRGATSSIDGLNVDGKKFLKNIARLSKKHDNVPRLLSDTINVYGGINTTNRPEIDWIFEGYSDLVRTHDALIEIRRIQDEERRAMWNMAAAERIKKEDEKRKKIDEERKIYEYEDDSYIIRLPKDNNEIVTEGTKQHICIGGYTSSHSYGNTNLFFLRKKTTPDQPFYAIEMDTSKRIVQIHGFGNKWLGNDPEAIPTVVRWLRKHDIKCDQKILTCKAKGYSRVNEYVEMPMVD